MKLPKDCRIDINLNPRCGLPNFISLGHRHFEKEKPTAISSSSAKTGLYRMPIDLVRMVIPAGSPVLDGVEEISFGYVKR